MNDYRIVVVSVGWHYGDSWVYKGDLGHGPLWQLFLLIEKKRKTLVSALPFV